MWSSTRTVAPTPSYIVVQIPIPKTIFVKEEAVKLRTFPFSLSGEAKIWLNELNEGKITSWNEMIEAFISRYFSLAKFQHLLNKIHSFNPRDNESLIDAWLRMKSMLRNFYGHGLTKGTIIQIFYHGLDDPTQGILDAKGIFLHNTPNEAFKILEEKSSHKPEPETVVSTGGSNIDVGHEKIDREIRNDEGKHTSDYYLKDDTPMCEPHEVNYVQGYHEGYHDRNSKPPYSNPNCNYPRYRSQNRMPDPSYFKIPKTVMEEMMREWLARKTEENERMKNQVVEFECKIKQGLRNRQAIIKNLKKQFEYLEKIQPTKSLSRTTNTKPRHEFVNKPPSIQNDNDRDCTGHISYMNAKTFADDVSPNHVGDKDLKSIHGVRIRTMTKKEKNENADNERGLFECMSTRSSSSNLVPPFFDPESVIRTHRRNLGDPSLLLDYEEINMNPNNVQGPPPTSPAPQNDNGPPGLNLQMPALDLQTMEELCQPTMNGRGRPIAPNGVTDDALRLYLFPYSLTHHATAWFDLLLKNSIHTFQEMALKFLSKYFPPSMVMKLRNDISNFRQLLDESLFEAWELYKLLINRRLEECYDLIENMTAHRNEWDTSAHRGKSCSSTTSSSFEIASLAQQMIEMRKDMLQMETFLRTARALVDVYGEELILRDGDEKLMFYANSTLKLPHKETFLRTARALVDVYGEELILRDGDEKLMFYANSTLKLPHNPTPSSDPVAESSLTPFKDINLLSEETDDIDDPVPIPMVFETPLDSFDSSMDSFDTAFTNPLFELNFKYTLNYDNPIFDIQNEDSDASETETIMDEVHIDSLQRTVQIPPLFEALIPDMTMHDIILYRIRHGMVHSSCLSLYLGLLFPKGVSKSHSLDSFELGDENVLFDPGTIIIKGWIEHYYRGNIPTMDVSDLHFFPRTDAVKLLRCKYNIIS
nr:hypothetical protein [Tanacetum cinerariifolium]